MKKLLSVFLAMSLVTGAFSNVFAVEEGAIPGDYEYVNDAEKDFVENVLDNRTYNEYNDTSVFEGHKTYLLQEGFVEDRNESYTGVSGVQAMPAGWDVDRRGGAIRTDNSSLHLYDASGKYRIFMTHDLMPHKEGDLTLETAAAIYDTYRDGYFIELKGGGRTIVRLETSGTSLCYSDKKGELNAIAEYKPNEKLPIKVILHMTEKTADIIAGGTAKYGVPFAEDVQQADNVSLGTSESGIMHVQVPYVHVYVNYIVNERFITTEIGKTPYDWKLSQTGLQNTGTVATQAQRSDVNSYQLTTSSVLTVPRLTKNYKNDASKLVTEFCMLVPNRYDGIAARLLSGENQVMSISTNGSNFVLPGGSVLYENYYENFWYRFKIITDTDSKTADVYVNFRKYAENVPLTGSGKINGVEFTSGKKKGSSCVVDDVLVYPDLPLPTGYPEEPRTIEPDKNVKEVGMLMYSMWREGFHFGWDRLSPLKERTPYQGYYTEGEGETADWAIKWQKEHGITYQIYTWSGVERTEDGPIKRPIRSQAWLDGLHEAQFDMDWCLMWSTPTDKSIRGLNDFKNNILPFWIEYCWKDPNYKRIDNKFLIYTYSVHAIRDLLGGDDGFRQAIDLMNEEAKKLGADGVIFVAVEGGNFSNEEAESLGMYRYTYGWGIGGASNGVGVINGITARMEEGDFRSYIPSVPMGYEDSPWRVGGYGGFMTIKEIKDVLTTVNDNVSKWKTLGNRAADMVVLTCWDEWGEGHFWCPSRTHGFGYMNAVRECLTTAGELQDEKLPSKQSYARMNVLYPMGRQALKLMKDLRETDKEAELEPENLILMQKLDFSNEEDFNRAEIEKSVENLRWEDGCLVFDCLGADPSVFVNGLSLDASAIKAVRITASQPIAGTNTLYYQTTDDTSMGVGGKRFEAAMPTSEMQSIFLYAANDKKLTGTLTRARIDPPDSTTGTMRVKSIEFFTSNDKKYNLTVNGKDYDLKAPLQVSDGTSYMSVYEYFHGHLLVPCYWYRKEGRLHIEYDDKTIELYDGKTEYTINGVKYNFSSPAYYDDGNFYVPVREFFEAVGYKVDWNGEKNRVILSTEKYLETAAVPSDSAGVWSFDRNGDLEGWTSSWGNPICDVEDGCMKSEVLEDVAIFSCGGLSIKASEYKSLKIRVKNASAANTLRFFYTSDTVKAFGSPNRMLLPVSSNDTDFKEYTIDFTQVPNYGGTLSSIRIDFAGTVNGGGTVYIDKISFEK